MEGVWDGEVREGGRGREMEGVWDGKVREEGGGREGEKQNTFSAKQTIPFGSWNDENTSMKYRHEI